MAMKRIYEDGLGCVFLVQGGEVRMLDGVPDGAGIGVLNGDMMQGAAMTSAEMAEYCMALDDSGTLVSTDDEAVFNDGFRLVAQADPEAASNEGSVAVEFWPERMMVSKYLFGMNGVGRVWEAWLREPQDAERDAYDRAQEHSDNARRRAVEVVSRHNLGVVIERMALDGVGSIEIDIAGESDDGAVQAVRLLPNSGKLTAECAGLLDIRWDEKSEEWAVTEKAPEAFGALIRHVAWDLLQTRFPGWWNDLGGSGTMRITAEGMQVQFQRGVEEVRHERYVETPAVYRPEGAGHGDDGPQP